MRAGFAPVLSLALARNKLKEGRMLDCEKLRFISLLGDIAEKSILQLCPYDHINIRPEVSRVLSLFNDNVEDLDPDLRVKFIPSMVVVAKARIASYFGMLNGSIVGKFQNDCDVIDDVYKKLYKHENQIYSSSFNKKEMKRIIKDCMARIYCDFVPTQSDLGLKGVKYQKSITKEINFCIGFDLGVNRPWTSLSIGLSEPKWSLDIAVFYGGVQSSIQHTDAVEYNERLNSVLVTIKPWIETTMKEVVENLQGKSERGRSGH